MTTEMQEIERRLAQQTAEAIVFACCASTDDGWLDSSRPFILRDIRLPEAIRYLEWRGLLERREDAPHVVRVKE